MKKYKKIVYLFLILMINISLAGCQNNVQVESTSENQSSSTNESNNDFKKYNVLSIGKVKIDREKNFDLDQDYDLRVKVTNNSDKIIRDVSITFYAYDKEGTMINSKESDSYGSIKQNKSFYIEGMIEANEDIDTVKVELYTYNIGENYYKVDLISKYAEVYINN